VSNAIQFSSDGTIHSMDGQVLNHAVRPSSMSDAQKAAVGITTNTSDYASFNTGAGQASQGSSTLRVQLHQPTGLVKVAGFEVRPEVAQTLTEAAPEVFVEPAAQEAKAKAEADTAKAEEITREDLNRHPDEQIEAAHQHFVGEVSTQNQVALLVYAHRGEAPPAELINRIASEMHEPLDRTIDKINAISMATQAQFSLGPLDEPRR
jgi:hypothetical protein